MPCLRIYSCYHENGMFMIYTQSNALVSYVDAKIGIFFDRVVEFANSFLIMSGDL